MKLLVAEDHQTLAHSIADGLREEGYAVDLSFDGNESLQLAQANRYDAIVLDMMLPGTDGWTILPALRGGGLETPVLCLTARDAVEDRVRGLNLGADDYLVKPFEWDELLARVRALVRRGYGRRTPKITVGDLEVDTARRSARRGRLHIALSDREFALLEYLAHRHGQIVSRSEIWNHLWDQHNETTSNVVDVYIGYLRKKIDHGHRSKLIHTRRSHGYMLADYAMEDKGR